MKHYLPTTLIAGATVALACNSGSGPTTRFDPPNTQFAGALGISTPPPVTQDQALAIAAAAAGGTAVGVEQEMEGNTLMYEVKVQTASGLKEVEVRASDGGVVEIEADDGASEDS
jgi:hypothetical protein